MQELLFLFILFVVLFVFAPVIMLRRHNKTIREINFTEINISITAFAALWMKSKKDSCESRRKIENNKSQIHLVW